MNGGESPARRHGDGVPTDILGARLRADELPPSVSARALLRLALPSIYQDPPDGLVMRFVLAMERVLDPRMALLDCRGAYFDRNLAPDDMVAQLAAWIGLDVAELPAHAARALLAKAKDLAEMRGTGAGITLALACCLPGVGFAVDDDGCTIAGQPDELRRAPDRVQLRIRASRVLSLDEQRVVRRVVMQQCPLEVGAVLIHGYGEVSLGGPA